jgi:hypothetical protein
MGLFRTFLFFNSNLTELLPYERACTLGADTLFSIRGDIA